MRALNRVFSILLSASVAFGASGALAGDYGKVGNTELIYLGSMGVDFDVRNALIADASSIEFVGFSQTPDDYGFPFLQAVREAQTKRGATVRFAYDRMVSHQGKDTVNEVKAVISDPSLVCRGEAFCAHPIEKLSSGVGLLDYVHEKFIVLNRGTPREMIIVGIGRGLTADSAPWNDSAFVIRRIDQAKPYAGDAIKKIVDSLFDALKKLASRSWFKIPTQVSRGTKMDFAGPRKRFAKDDAERRLVEEILDVLSRPAREQAADALKPWQFQPESIRSMSNDLFKQLVEREKGQSRGSFVNDNQLRLNERIRNFNGRIEFTSYSIGPTEETYRALVDFVNRGNTLDLFTNGPDAFHEGFKGTMPAFLQKLAPNTINMRYPAAYTFETVARMIRETKDGPGKINLHVLNPHKVPVEGKSPYLHRRMMVFTSETERFVYTGSDPITWSSAKKNDECLFEIVDSRFAEWMKGVTRSEIEDYDLLRYDEILRFDAKKPFLYRCLRTMVKKIF